MRRGYLVLCALVGFDFSLADRLAPPVTVVTQDPAALGAAKMLFARIEGDGAPLRTLEMHTRLIVRGSGEIRLPPGAVR